MNHRKTNLSLAAGTLLVLASLGSTAWADGVIEIDDALAHKVENAIHLLPNVNGQSLSGISVQATNGVLRLEGVVENLESRRAVNDVLKGIEGLHMVQIDDHISQQ